MVWWFCQDLVEIILFPKTIIFGISLLIFVNTHVFNFYIYLQQKSYIEMGNVKNISFLMLYTCNSD